MKKYLNYSLVIALLSLSFVACEEVEDNAIPHIAAPALILIEGGPAFSADQTVDVTAEFLELRKEGVNIDTLGAAPNIQTVNVAVTNDSGTQTLAEGASLSNGVVSYTGAWEEILGTTPESGMSAQLEFFGTSTDGIPFRKYYTVTVE